MPCSKREGIGSVRNDMPVTSLFPYQQFAAIDARFCGAAPRAGHPGDGWPISIRVKGGTLKFYCIFSTYHYNSECLQAMAISFRSNIHRSGLSVEIAALARALEVDGIALSLQCFLITGPVPRYEILVRGRGESGVVDIPLDKEPELGEQMEEVAVCFATALRTRSGYFS